jgi:hypothetical protein
MRAGARRGKRMPSGAAGQVEHAHPWVDEVRVPGEPGIGRGQGG